MRRKLLPIGAMIALCWPGAAAALDAGGSGAIPAVKVTVYPGEIITAEMIVLRAGVQLPGLGPVVTDRQSLIGKAARRTLLPGLPIPKNAIREPYVVLQGKTVSLVFQSGNITITGVALALESGSAGDVINARNPDSGVVIRGLIQADGSLRTQ
ncbi:MAG: flagellar basal body P-ring formation chaperone FlgA [Rhodomicrobium sp.]